MRHLEQIAKRHHRTFVHDIGELPVFFEVIVVDGLLQGCDDIRVECVVLATVHVLQQSAGALRPAWVPGVPGEPPPVFVQVGEAHALHAADGAGKTKVHYFPVQADDLEQLCAAVAGDSRDPHLRGDLVETLVDPAPVIDTHEGAVASGDLAAADHVVEHLESEVRINGRCAIADERREMMGIPCRPRFHHQIGIAAYALPNQPVMHGAGCQERVHRQLVSRDVPIREHQDELAFAHRGNRAVANIDDCVAQLDVHGIAQLDAFVAKGRLLHVQELPELAFGKNR